MFNEMGTGEGVPCWRVTGSNNWISDPKPCGPAHGVSHRGFLAGLGIAAIGIIADRLISAWASERKKQLGMESRWWAYERSSRHPISAAA